MKITLIRHTAVAPEWASLCYGQTDIPVAETFAEEAKRVRDNLDLSLYDHIYSSPLSRARSLAEVCVPEVDHNRILLDARLQEMNFGTWEGRPWKEILPPDLDVHLFFEYFITKAAPGGESLQDLSHRVKDFIQDIYDQGVEHALCFCHGGVINAARSLTGMMALQESFQALPPYGSQLTILINRTELITQ